MFSELVPWEAHLEVWLLIAGVLSIGIYSSRVLQPKAVAAGMEPISLAQKLWFVGALVLMWVVSDWPIHEIAETRLYFVHMAQHLVLSMMVPGMLVLSIPSWLFDLVIEPGSRTREVMAKLSSPIVAGVIFNGLTLLLHWGLIVQLSADYGYVHFVAHITIFTSGLLMWMPVSGPVKEWQLSALGKCVYLFAMSIVPTVPGGWLLFAEQVVYPHYDTVERLWDIDVLTDQQAAGAVMKLLGGFFLWAVIVVVFFKWANKEMKKNVG